MTDNNFVFQPFHKNLQFQVLFYFSNTDLYVLVYFSTFIKYAYLPIYLYSNMSTKQLTHPPLTYLPICQSIKLLIPIHQIIFLRIHLFIYHTPYTDTNQPTYLQTLSMLRQHRHHKMATLRFFKKIKKIQRHFLTICSILPKAASMFRHFIVSSLNNSFEFSY